MSFSNWKDIKKTRKDHRCVGCLETIPKGSPASYFAGIWEGDFCAGHLCIPCEEHLTKYSRDFRDGWGEGEIGEHRREIERKIAKRAGDSHG